MDNIGNFLGSLIGTGSQMYGQQNAGEAISKASTAGIGEARAGMGDVSGYWGAQRNLGTNADTALSSSLGIGGQPANYSNFMNMPGYGFAVQQGTQAAERQAAAMGNAGNSGTAAMIGNQVTGTAMQDYNNYIGQLMGAANLGSTANTAMTDARLRTAGNVEQLGMNSGLAQAGMYTGMGQTVGGALGAGNPYASGVAGANGSGLVSGLGGLISSGVNYLGGLFGGSSGPSTSGGAYNASVDPSVYDTSGNFNSSGLNYGNINSSLDPTSSNYELGGNSSPWGSYGTSSGF